MMIGSALSSRSLGRENGAERKDDREPSDQDDPAFRPGGLRWRLGTGDELLAGPADAVEESGKGEGGSRVSTVANACKLYDVSVYSGMYKLWGSQPGIERSNKTVHCQHVSLGCPPAQLRVSDGATLPPSGDEDKLAPPTTFCSTRHNLVASYPSTGEMDSALPSNTTESDLRRMDGGRMIFPVKKDVCGVMVIITCPESEYAVLDAPQQFRGRWKKGRGNKVSAHLTESCTILATRCLRGVYSAKHVNGARGGNDVELHRHREGVEGEEGNVEVSGGCPG